MSGPEIKQISADFIQCSKSLITLLHEAVGCHLKGLNFESRLLTVCICFQTPNQQYCRYFTELADLADGPQRPLRKPSESVGSVHWMDFLHQVKPTVSAKMSDVQKVKKNIYLQEQQSSYRTTVRNLQVCLFHRAEKWDCERRRVSVPG